MRRPEEDKIIPVTYLETGHGHAARTDLFYYTNQIVNLVFIGNAGSEGWVLVDTGMPRCAYEIIKVAEDRFGKNVPPAAIILTHGHFDHVSNVSRLCEKWKVPVYIHPLEMPFVNGSKDYPDASADNGERLLSKIASIYPNESQNLERYLTPLPANGVIPELSDWQWIHTPGHTPGHISLFRKSDRCLIAGDAFVTVRDESFATLLNQYPEINTSPSFCELDKKTSLESVKKLFALKPTLAITGHGTAMEGEALLHGLQNLIAGSEKVYSAPFDSVKNSTIHISRLR